MKLTVKDIKELWNNGQAELVAGAEGLDRPVAFYDMMEQPDIKPWLRKELLLITTGYAIRNDKEAVLTLIRDLNEAGRLPSPSKPGFLIGFPRKPWSWQIAFISPFSSWITGWGLWRQCIR